MAKARPAQDVIEQAICENANAAKLCYTLVVIFVIAGLGVLGVGAYRGDGLTALAGAVASGLFWPALAQARQIREMNMAVRLLEIPLGKAASAKDAAEALQKFFESRFK